ncbi:uncharacterized protein F4807DRAFT_450255 [Annulohypoxylon truncatum]|uniref:uncharacterized protein n=1 Tax=Annulohypoxylon truncatum TaxID=327061 RepID=UPI0020082C04|nr:uncharacterized protein F4807DRAFT_450255 [Annulohypoxylon truncatum]KAI1212598.1 hypothetical protein F4807DRAFT_450255 [Annulohypoxylon truncatum]
MELTPEEKATWNESRQPLIVGILVTFLVLTNATSVARVVTSVHRHRKLQIDDYLMICAVILSDGIISAMLAAVSKGFGLHQFRVLATDPQPPFLIVQILQIIWAYAVLNGFCFSTIKLSILFFLRRLFWVTRWFKIAWWVNVAYVILWTIGSTLFYIFQCAPIDFYWNKIYAGAGITPPEHDANGQCIKALASIGTPIILNTVGDLFVLLLPLPILLKLQTTTPKRLRLLGLFVIGFMATAAGFVRFGFIFASNTRADATYSSVEFLLWSNIEEALGIVCANIPIIATLFEQRKKRKSMVGPNGQCFQSAQASSSRRFTRSTTLNHEGSYEALNDKQHDFAMEDLSLGSIARIERGEHFERSPTTGIAVTTSITTQFDSPGRAV